MIPSFENKLNVMSHIISLRDLGENDNLIYNTKVMKHFYESLDDTRSSYFH